MTSNFKNNFDDKNPGQPATNAKEIQERLNKFLKGSTYEIQAQPVDVVKEALFLLQYLPASRFAALEFLCSIFDDYVNGYIVQINISSVKAVEQDAKSVNLIEEIQESLMAFVDDNPESWSPLISSWSVNLLGVISRKYSEKLSIPNNLNELLQMWMSCRAIKVLIEITSQCFSRMLESAPQSCVDSLLTTSMEYSHNFDWVVAHIGSCFPDTIISRVLGLGLQDFHECGMSPHVVHREDSMRKLSSVVNILSHLAVQHSLALQNALLGLFENSLTNAENVIYCSTVPYLLRLASMSPVLLSTMFTNFMQIASYDLAVRIVRHFQGKASFVLKNHTDLMDILVCLITEADNNSLQVINFLMDMATKGDALSGAEPAVVQICASIMDRVVVQLHRAVCRKENKKRPQLLKSLESHLNQLCDDLVTSAVPRESWICRILSSISIAGSENQAVEVLGKLLVRCTDVKMSFFVEVAQLTQNVHSVAFSLCISLFLTEASTGLLERMKVVTGLRNIRIMIDLEKDNAAANVINYQLNQKIIAQISCITSLLCSEDFEISSLSREIVTSIDLPKSLSLATQVSLASSLVIFLFQSLSSFDISMKFKNCQSTGRCLKELSNYGVLCQQIVLQKLLETALSKGKATVFGGNSDCITPKSESLLAQNLSSSVSLSLTAVLPSGTIGDGLRQAPKPSQFSASQQLENKQLFLDVLWACASSLPSGATSVSEAIISLPVAQYLALLLIENIAPDVMFNGLPWPDEDFMRITVERDLVIRNKFLASPILWDILEVIGHGPGSICYCSSLLRALAATLMSHWESCRLDSTAASPQQLLVTTRLIQLMKLGQLLPVPLTYLDQLIPLVHPYEAHLLLLVIWRYMKENPPVPDPTENEVRLKKQISHHLIQVRNILHKNINKLGHLYPLFCPDHDR